MKKGKVEASLFDILDIEINEAELMNIQYSFVCKDYQALITH